MGKLSKKFRQIPLIRKIIIAKREFFSNFIIYHHYRNWIMTQKWRVKFFFFPRYKKARTILSIYSNIKIFRPHAGFSDFDLAVTAYDNATKQKLFIQIVTKQNFNRKGKDEFKSKVANFSAKNHIYQKVTNFLKSYDQQKLTEIITVKDFIVENDLCVFVTYYRDYQPIAHLFKQKGFIEKQEYLKKQLKFYYDFFNKYKIAWCDATPNNLVTLGKSYNIVPIDFATTDEIDFIKFSEINDKAYKGLSEYIATGKYPYWD